MSSFITILLGIVFLITLGYYISSLYSVHYKTVWKNKSNIKYRVKTSSITSYAPLFGLILATIIFAFYFRNSVQSYNYWSNGYNYYCSWTANKIKY